MPRRKAPTSGPLEELRAKARELQAQRVSEPVWIDSDTYERLVQFIEDERCSLDEALRRAVRIGVQVLLSDRRGATTGPIEHDYGPAYVPKYTRPDMPEPEAHVPPVEKFSDGSTNFAAVSPPGMF